MKIRKSKKRDLAILEVLKNKATPVEEYESNSPLLEQLIENILSEKSNDLDVSQKVQTELLNEFVDWNEIRIVASERLTPFFGVYEDGQYKVKVLQAVLNKIFSRSGSLDYQFLLDFEQDDLEDYLSGIMELNESTRKRLLLRVFKKKVLPVTTDHEIIFEIVGSTFVPGDEVMKELFSGLELGQLEGIKQLLDQIIDEAGPSEEILDESNFKSKTLQKILSEINKAA